MSGTAAPLTTARRWGVTASRSRYPPMLQVPSLIPRAAYCQDAPHLEPGLDPEVIFPHSFTSSAQSEKQSGNTGCVFGEGFGDL